MANQTEINKKNQLVIIFNFETGKKNFDDFARFDEILHTIQEMKDISISHVEDQFNVMCIETDLTSDNSEIIKKVEPKIDKKDFVPGETKISAYQSITFYFRTYLTSQNADFFTTEIFLPFILIRKKHLHINDSSQSNRFNFILTISNLTEEKYYHKFSHDMIVESLINQPHWRKSNYIDKVTNKMVYEVEINNPTYNQCFDLRYYDGEPKPQRFQVKDIGYFHNRIPWLILSSEAYGVLSENVEELFPTPDSLLESGLNFLDDLESQLGDLNGINFSSDEQREGFRETLLKTSIKRTCLGILMDLFPDRKLDKEENDYLKSVYEYCKSLSLLSFLFVLTFLGAPKESDISEKKKLVEILPLKNLLLLIRNSQDYASGVLQLIENAVEYAEGNAILWFHVLKKGEIQHDNDPVREDIEKFLEIKIIDYNDKTIPETFHNNLEERGEDKDFKGYKLTVADFFQPRPEVKDIWDSFYLKINNINHHFGLNHFLSTIKYGGGDFRVISSQQISPSETEIFKWPSNQANDQNIGEGREQITSHIPGSEYTIRLPLLQAKKNREQVSSGTGLKPDFTDEILTRKIADIDFVELVEKSELLGGPFSQREKMKKVSELVTEIENDVRDNISQPGSLPILCFYFNQDSPSIYEKQYIIDIFTKALLEYIHLNSALTKHRIAIVNASRTFVINFTIGFATYCQKTDAIPEIKERVRDTQIYICDQSPDLELYFVNGDLASTYKSNEFFFGKKGTSPEPHNLVRVLLESTMPDSPGNQYEVAPFDLVCKASQDSPMTLFEQRTKLELERDIQQPPFGCALRNAHVRVGSKIHITDQFYDATLLLASDYYTSRFAYLLAERIRKLVRNLNENITLIAYENYSEFVVVEAKNILKDIFKFTNVNYAVYQQDIITKFKYEDQIKNYQNFFIIVPINSTLSTHDKITAALSNYLSSHDYLQNEATVTNLALILVRDNSQKDKEGLTEVEKKYWKGIKIKERCVNTKFFERISLGDPTKFSDSQLKKISNDEVNVYYNILLESKWQDPQKCDSCFPQDQLTNEVPMLEVSKTSVMSMAMAGLQKAIRTRDRPKIPPALGDIQDLKKYLIYRHLNDDGNHYLYYFKTEEIAQKLISNSSDKYIQWKAKIKQDFIEKQEEYKKKNLIVYDVVVAPMNSTNGAFVQDLITNVFDNLSFVIYIDPSREFRENIKAKFSQLTTIHEDNKLLGRNSMINFHYVNDTITSGNTIRRTQSLLKSLFPLKTFEQRSEFKLHEDKTEAEVKEKNGDIGSTEVNVFSTVILLLNRCSVATRADYVSPEHFYRYYDLNISSIRNNRENSCIVCKNQKDFQAIASYCSANELAEFWQKNAKSIQVESFEHYEEFKGTDEFPQSEDFDHREKQFRRLFCAHNFSKGISKVPINNNDPKIIRKIFFQIIDEEMKILNDYTNIHDGYESVKHVVEYLISYLKVLTRPFLVFRKSTLEAIFKIILEFMELFINKIDEQPLDQIPSELRNISKLLDALLNEEWGWPETNKQINLFENPSKEDSPIPNVELQEDERDKINKLAQDLFKILISRMSTLGSKYLIRKENLLRIRECAQKIGLDEKGFDLFYLAQIKRLITLNKDESIELWLDSLLSTGEESFNPENPLTDHYGQPFSLEKSFYRDLFLENTHIIHDAIQEMSQKITEPVEQANSNMASKVQDNLKHYFFDNFVKLRSLHEGSQENSISTHYLEPQSLTKIISMVQLFNLLQEKKKPDAKEEGNGYANEQFYEQLAQLIKEITGCDSLHFAILMDELMKSHYFLIPIDPEQKSRFSKIIKEFPDKESVFQPEDSESDWVVKFNINGGSEFYISIAWEKNSEAHKDYKTYVNRLYAIRDILAFRYDLIRRLDHDFTSTAFLQFLNQKEFTQKLSNIKTATHTRDEERQFVCNRIVKLCDSDEEYPLSDLERSLAADDLKLAADSLISGLAYLRLTREYASPMNTHKKVIIPEDLTEVTINLNDKLINILNEIKCPRSGSSTTRARIHVDGSNSTMISNMMNYKGHYLLLFLVALCQNAVKHGLVEKEESKDGSTDSYFVSIEISIDDEKIEIKNAFSNQNDTSDPGSFSSLKEIENYYATNFLDQELIIQPAKFINREDDSMTHYIVELPIIRIKEE